MSDDLTQNLPTSQDGTLAQILTTVQNLSTRMESLEQKVEERLYDTRPIWEKVQADIARLQEGQDALRGEVHEMNKEQRNTGRKLSVLNDGLLRMQADFRDIDDRVRGLEGQRS
jgi:predicted  nucleic acid-binding Zn-ribbon protein